MTVEERVIEALKRLRGFDLDLEPQEAQRLYRFNIQSLTEDFTAIIEDCAKIADAETEGASTYQWQHAAEEIAENIRALANSTEKGKENHEHR